MDQTKSQAFNFAYEVMPIMFHSQTNDFFTYLQRDGVKFLAFWWDYIGKQLPEEQHRSFEGMQSKIVQSEEDQRIAVVQLPEPVAENEIYFLVFISKPEKRFAWVRLPNTRVFSLVRKFGPEYPNSTEMGEITPRGRYVPVGPGPEIDEASVLKTARKLLTTPAR